MRNCSGANPSRRDAFAHVRRDSFDIGLTQTADGSRQHTVAARIGELFLLSSTAMDDYPAWRFFPSRLPAPSWAEDVLRAFGDQAATISSIDNSGVGSDDALAAVRPALQSVGFEVEAGKKKEQKISRPVLFGDNGKTEVAYEVDGYFEAGKAVLEVEAGRGAANNADYRDLVRASLMVDVDYLILAMMLEYSGGGTQIRSFAQTKKRIDAIYASDRLKLPLKGVLLIGY